MSGEVTHSLELISEKNIPEDKSEVLIEHEQNHFKVGRKRGTSYGAMYIRVKKSNIKQCDIIKRMFTKQKQK